mgnify:CR=1 FL=1
MSKLKCSIVEDLMPLYIEDLLSEETKKEIELHLDECENCKEVYDELKKGVNLGYEKKIDFLHSGVCRFRRDFRGVFFGKSRTS